MARWRAEFLLLSAIWGASFLFIKVGDDAFAPLQVSFGRILLGAVFLLGWLAVTRDRLPRGARAWWHLFVAGLLFNAVPFSLFAYAETHISSILAGIWNATTPLMTLLFAVALLPQERPTRRRVTGLLIGFAGVVVLLGPWSGLSGGALLGNLAGLGAAVCYGLGFNYTRRHLSGRPESAASLSAAQLGLATLQLAVLTPFVTDAPASLPVDSVLSVVALGVLGTGFAYILNYDVIRAAGATVASTVTYLIPLFAAVLGVLVLDEALGWNEPAGAVVVILGILASEGRLRPLRRRRAVVRAGAGRS